MKYVKQIMAVTVMMTLYSIAEAKLTKQQQQDTIDSNKELVEDFENKQKADRGVVNTVIAKVKKGAKSGVQNITTLNLKQRMLDTLDKRLDLGEGLVAGLNAVLGKNKATSEFGKAIIALRDRVVAALNQFINMKQDLQSA